MYIIGAYVVVAVIVVIVIWAVRRRRNNKKCKTTEWSLKEQFAELENMQKKLLNDSI